MLALDHIFVFCDAHVSAARFEAEGFEVTTGRHHPGQGTANRSVLFRDFYLELIYLPRRDEAERNRLRLDRRADYRETGHCPFGVGLRGAVGAADRASFFHYDAPYDAPFDTWVANTLDTRPQLPVLFVMEGWEGTTTGAHPAARPTLEVPVPMDAPPGVAVERGPYRLIVELDDGPRFDVGELITLR